VHLLEGGTIVDLQAGQLSLLLVVVHRLLAFFPRLRAFGEQGVPEPATFLHLAGEEPLLLFGRIEAVVEGLQHEHTRSIPRSAVGQPAPEMGVACGRRGASSPKLKARGFAPPYS